MRSLSQNMPRHAVGKDTDTAHYLRTFLPLQWDSVDKLLADAVAGGPRKRFVQFFLELRVRHRYRHKSAHLEDAVKGHGRARRWVAVFKQQLFNWWRVMHVRAVPYSHHTFNEVAQRRKLRHAGLHCGRDIALEQRAAHAAKKIWDHYQNSDNVVWMDNWYKDRFTTTPGDSNHSVDTTIVAVLDNPAPTPYGGHMTAEQIARGMFITAARLCNFLPQLQGTIGVTLDGSLRREWIRVPLDFVRGTMYPNKWQPLLLSEMRTGMHIELLQLMQMMHNIQVHTRKDLVLLVDMKIHAALLRFLYGRSYASRNLALPWASVGLTYGIWHPYKYACKAVFRRFFPVLALSIDPGLRPTQDVPSDRPLGYLEKLYAAILLVAQSWRVPMKQMVEWIEALRQQWEPETEVVVNKLRAL